MHEGDVVCSKLYILENRKTHEVWYERNQVTMQENRKKIIAILISSILSFFKKYPVKYKSFICDKFKNQAGQNMIQETGRPKIRVISTSLSDQN